MKYAKWLLPGGFVLMLAFRIWQDTRESTTYRAAADKKIAELNAKRDSDIAHEQAAKTFAFDDCDRHSGVAVMGFGPSVVCLSTIGVDLPRVYVLSDPVGTVRDERGKKLAK